MNKRNLISKIASHFDLDETGVSIFVDSIFETIGKELNKGKNINIPEFGKFIVRNKTSDGVRKRFITFSPSKKFAEEINNNYSELSPVVIKMLQPDGLGIEIKEISFEYGDDNFTYLTFEDGTETGNEITAAGEEPISDEIILEEEQTLPLIHSEEVITDTELEEQPARDVPYLIGITKDKHHYIQEEIKEDVLNETDENIPLLEEDKQLSDETFAGDLEETPVTEDELQERIYTLLPEDLIKEDIYIEVIEEQISAEKEIIIKDIEEYLTRERKSDDVKSEDTFDTKEQESIKDDFPDEPDNYFKRENVYTGNNNEITEKTQNVFLYDFYDTDFDTIGSEVSPSHEIEQNVFLDLESFFNDNESINEELIPVEEVTEKTENIIPPPENAVENPVTTGDVISESATSNEIAAGEMTTDEVIAGEMTTDEVTAGEITSDEDTAAEVYNEDIDLNHDKHFPSLKDDIDTSTLEEEILQMLASREKAIKDLNEYGLKLEAKIEIPPADESIEDKKDFDTHDEIIIHETSQQEAIKDDLVKTDDIPIIEETPDIDLYEELNKRYRELEENVKTDSVISEEGKKNLQNNEMLVFDRLIEEKPEPVKETPPPQPIQQIIIHDPGSRIVEKVPKSLSEALEDVHLDGIIEHLESGKDASEVKSYDDVFKPADMQFIPNSTPAIEFRKPKKWLKFFLYLAFIMIFSLMSFFLYKSILTPSKSSQHSDTTGIKKYDSLSVSLKLVDTSLKTGSIILNEFEIEKDGDIIYRQTENGFIVQIASFEKHTDALKFITNLKDKSIEARIERIDLPMDNTEYRIVIGPFATLQEAKSYFSSSKMLLNYIKVLTPSNTNIFF
jgi:nucleoid DNA-binding protein